MRYRLMATYRGAPYEAGIGPASGEVVLFAACPPPDNLGFEPATGHWRKELRITEVQAVWESRPVGTFRGDRCIVLDDLGDQLHIGYLGHDAYRAEQLGYWQVDRGVFELVAAREEVTDISEERTDYTPAPGAAPRTSYRAAPGPAAGQDSPGRYRDPAPYPGPARAWDQPDPAAAGYRPAPGYLPAAVSAWPGPAASRDGSVRMPAAADPPLPLEAQALRATSAGSRRDQDPPAPLAAPRGEPAGPGDAAADFPTGPQPVTWPDLAAGPPLAAWPDFATDPRAAAAADLAAGPPVASRPPATAEPTRRGRSAGRRMATERIFSELAGLAAIPAASYSVGEEVDGAMCLLETSGGFEVFSCAGGARHEVRVFSDEESACFYLFGVLAADSVRTGALIPAAGPPLPAVAQDLRR